MPIPTDPSACAGACLALRSDPTESISQTIERTGIKPFRECLAAGEPADQEPASAERPEEPIEER